MHDCSVPRRDVADQGMHIQVVGYHIEPLAAEAVSGGAASDSAALPPPPSKHGAQ